MNGKYEINDFVLTNWRLVEKIGTGAYGCVYKAVREDFGKKYESAIKIMTIPKDEDDYRNLKAEGMTDSDVDSYYQEIIRQIVEECNLMYQLDGFTNIVSYKDHDVVKHEKGPGSDVIIRMELLTPVLKRYDDKHPISIEDIIRMGIDICKALEHCQEKNIIHRDIKPQNILVSEHGDFKLGDFGIAKHLDETRGARTYTGTPNYMAPEVRLVKKYGSTVDLYSLGLVLYYFLNGKHLPFVKNMSSPTEKEEALALRTSGEPLQAPSGADEKLAKIILKACAYEPEDRYQTATEFREALEAWQKGEVVEDVNENPAVEAESDSDKTKSFHQKEVSPNVEKDAGGTVDFSEKQKNAVEKPKEKSAIPRWTISVCIGALLIGLLVFGTIMILNHNGDQAEETSEVSNEAKDETAKLTESTVSDETGGNDKGSEAQKGGSEEIAPTESPTPAPTEVPEVVTVFLKSKETSYSGDAVSGWTDYEYDTAGNLLRENGYDVNGSMKSYGEYSYDASGAVVKEVWYTKDFPSGMSVDHIYQYEYDTRGNMIKRITYERDGVTIQSWLECEYDDHDKKTKQTNYDAKGAVISTFVYERIYGTKGHQTNYTVYDSSGKISYLMTYDVDVNDNVLSSTTFYGDGSKLRSMVYQYDYRGNETKSSQYDAFDNLSYWSQSDYDEDGNLLQNMVYYANGEVYYGTKYEYISIQK